MCKFNHSSVCTSRPQENANTLYILRLTLRLTRTTNTKRKSLLAADLETASWAWHGRLTRETLFTVNGANNSKMNSRLTNLKAMNQKLAEQQLSFFNSFEILYIWFQNHPSGYKSGLVNTIVQAPGIVGGKKTKETETGTSALTLKIQLWLLPPLHLPPHPLQKPLPIIPTVGWTWNNFRHPSHPARDSALQVI